MIKFLFSLIVFFFVIRLLSRFFLMYILRKINNRGNIKKDFKKDKEGDVSINKVPKKTKSKSDKVGDYVDYEEID